MLEESTSHSREMINTASRLISQHFQKTIHFSKIIQLSEPDRRNLILRLIIENPTTGIPETIILKKTLIEKGIFDNKKNGETEVEQFSRFAHDWAGLAFLTQIGSHDAPYFYAGSLEHKFILIEDLGVGHPSLVGPLTRLYSPINLQEAHHALISYAHRLGQMHASTAGKSKDFIKILNQIYPHATRLFTPEPDISRVLNQCNILNTDKLNKLRQEIDTVIDFSLAENDFNVLLHGDICPDNVYYQHDNIRLIDFEFGDFGNALIDGVYPRMNMPSCWCSKALPTHVIQEMEWIYREELIKGIPTAADEKIFTKQLVYGCAYWVIRTIKQIGDIDLIDHEWVCPSGPIESDSKWEADKNTFRPRILSRLAAFITCAKDTGHLPILYETSTRLLSHLQKIWPETTFIDIFPVYQQN